MALAMANAMALAMALAKDTRHAPIPSPPTGTSSPSETTHHGAVPNPCGKPEETVKAKKQHQPDSWTRTVGSLRLHDCYYWPPVTCSNCGTLACCQAVNDYDVWCSKCVSAAEARERQQILYETDLAAGEALIPDPRTTTEVPF